jgi:hypothetical protein
MPTQLVAGAVAMNADPGSQLSHFGDQLLSRQREQVGIFDSLH